MTAATAMFASGVLAANASATFDLVKVSEVHTEAGALNDFVELQMYAGGQNLLMGHYIYVYNGTGGLVGDSPLPANAGSGESQRTFTIGNNATRDYNYGGAVVDPAAGAVCWNGSAAGVGGVDCVAWGSFTTGGGGAAMTSPPGPNAPAIPEGQSLQRRLTPGCATLLEGSDDTNNSATDFVVGAPTPRNNNVAPTEKLCTNTKPSTKKKCKKKKKKGKGKAGAAAKKKKCKKKKKKK